MGRRAKNKQGDPRPLVEEFQDKGSGKSSKKLGKRKAEVQEEDAPSKRPVKKLKESEAKKSKANEDGKSKKVAFAKEKSADKKKSKAAPPKDKKGKRKQESEEADELVEDGGSSEGWEDVEGEDSLQAQQK